MRFIILAILLLIASCAKIESTGKVPVGDSITIVVDSVDTSVSQIDSVIDSVNYLIDSSREIVPVSDKDQKDKDVGWGNKADSNINSDRIPSIKDVEPKDVNGPTSMIENRGLFPKGDFVKGC